MIQDFLHKHSNWQEPRHLNNKKNVIIYEIPKQLRPYKLTDAKLEKLYKDLSCSLETIFVSEQILDNVKGKGCDVLIEILFSHSSPTHFLRNDSPCRTSLMSSSKKSFVETLTSDIRIGLKAENLLVR